MNELTMDSEDAVSSSPRLQQVDQFLVVHLQHHASDLAGLRRLMVQQ